MVYIKDKTIIIGYDDGPLVLDSGSVLDGCTIKHGGSNIGRFIFREHEYLVHAEGNVVITGCTFVTCDGWKFYKPSLKERIREYRRRFNVFIRKIYIFKNCGYL